MIKVAVKSAMATSTEKQESSQPALIAQTDALKAELQPHMEESYRLKGLNKEIQHAGIKWV